jgi:predicted cupin superfamily sugar epimerase
MILFHLEAGAESSWHRVASEEVWVAQHGRVALDLGGSGPTPGTTTSVIVGTALADGDQPVATVPAHTWQRARAEHGDALVACVVSPEFNFADFELAHYTVAAEDPGVI